ncbi:MAG: VWA domain-containing protein [Trueperaceae bacterium]|nr:MAG: VWA domain-containing protein [Trueperaceae bacterium]
MSSSHRSPLRTMLTTLGLAALLAAASSALAQRTSVLLVLDASGSMYLKLADGQYRIAAAKDALSTFVSRLPDAHDLDVGLRIYGANVGALDEGACDDSELVVPVAGFDRATLLRTIRETQAKGATPIAHSLALAADDLRGVQGRAVIVLVTDGAESCGGDVRGAVEQLAEAGIEVDLRIIGFDLSPAASQSFEGLGTFENATSAVELAAALGRAVEVAAVDETHAVTALLTRDGEPTVDGARVRFVDAVSGNAIELSTVGGGPFTGSLPAGTYRAEVADAFAATPLVIGGLSVLPDAENAFAFELALAAEVSLSVEPSDPVASASVTVRFESAPGSASSWITVVPSDSSDGLFLAWAYVDGDAGETVLRLPDEPAELEARFHLTLPEGGTLVIGRSPVFTSRALEASVSAPGEVGSGAAFDVRWDGPNQSDDYVTIVAVAAPEGTWTDFAYAEPAGVATLVAPGEPGRYEVRYVSGQSGRTLASTPVLVVAVDASITAPAQVAADAEFAVAWQGPDNDDDYLTIVPAGAPEGSWLSYAYTGGGSPAVLTAPSEPGAYEVRYVLGQGDRTLARSAITVR